MIRAHLSRLIRREDGVAAIEFGLVVALFLPVVLVALDIGLAIRQRMQIDQVLHAGVQAAMRPGAEVGDITDAIAAAASVHAALGALDIRVDSGCFCRDAPGVSVSCTAACAPDARSRAFDLSAQMEYDSLFLRDMLPANIRNLQSRLRIEVPGTLGS